MRTLTRLFIHHGDASGLSLLCCGLIALVGLVTRMAGVW